MNLVKTVNTLIYASLVLCFGIGFGSGDATLALNWFGNILSVMFITIGILYYLNKWEQDNEPKFGGRK